VLHPGNGGGRQPLALEQLQRGRTYDLTGTVEQEITTDHAGHALINVEPGGRTAVRVTPRA
jgi:hypothetical protein